MFSLYGQLKITFQNSLGTALHPNGCESLIQGSTDTNRLDHHILLCATAVVD